MSLQNALTTTKIIETLENYARADDWKAEDIADQPASDRADDIVSDKGFWYTLLRNPEQHWNRSFRFHDVALSEWVARVPGSYYHSGSKIYRQLARSQMEFVSDRWVRYTPRGKSQKVMGGIGTLKQSPNEQGWHLASISTTNNASTGIPVLISEAVWTHHRLREGLFIDHGQGKWRKMTRSWARRFPSLSGIPKGYLVIDDPQQIAPYPNVIQPTLYHPFSIMEYENQNSKFYDFVYVTVDSSDPAARDQVRQFFTSYKDQDNRYGKYLIEPDVNHPLLEAVYTRCASPEELRSQSGNGSHLKLMLKRIRNERFNDQTIEQIKIAIDNSLTVDQLKRMGDYIQVSPNSWFSGGALHDESAALIDQCIQRNKLEELVDILVKENSQIFSQAS